MKPRIYSRSECDLRIEEFQEVMSGCDETIALIDQLLDRTYGADDGMVARSAIIRLRADAERALTTWVSRRPLL